MSKTKEELNELKKDVEAVNEKLQELTPEEIAQVSGGVLAGHCRLVVGYVAEIDHYPYREYDN